MQTKMWVSVLVAAVLIVGVSIPASVAAAAPADAARRIDAVQGDVKSISGTTLTLSTPERGDVQVATSDRTRYHTKDQSPLTFADLKVNDRLIVRGVWQTGKLQATQVVLIPANLRDKLGGKVASIDGATLTLTKIDGSSVKVVTTADTQFRSKDNLNAQLADIKVGDRVAAIGQLQGDTLTASHVGFRTPREQTGPIALGKISAISGNTLTVRLRFGETLTVNTTSGTYFVKRGDAGVQAIQLSDLKVGDEVMAIGPRSADGKSIEAKVIVAGKSGAQGAPRGKAPQSQLPASPAPVGLQG